LEVDLSAELPKKGGAGVKGLRLAATKPPASDAHMPLVKEHYPNLESLDLDESKVTCKGLEALRGLDKLKTIWLRDNPQIDDACWAVFEQLPALETLYLRGTKAIGERSKDWEAAKAGRKVIRQ
jgi:hypothetical protein